MGYKRKGKIKEPEPPKNEEAQEPKTEYYTWDYGPKSTFASLEEDRRIWGIPTLEDLEKKDTAPEINQASKEEGKALFDYDQMVEYKKANQNLWDQLLKKKQVEVGSEEKEVPKASVREGDRIVLKMDDEQPSDDYFDNLARFRKTDVLKAMVEYYHDDYEKVAKRYDKYKNNKAVNEVFEGLRTAVKDKHSSYGVYGIGPQPKRKVSTKPKAIDIYEKYGFLQPKDCYTVKEPDNEPINEEEECIVNVYELADNYTRIELGDDFRQNKDYEAVLNKHIKIIKSFKRNKDA